MQRVQLLTGAAIAALLMAIPGGPTWAQTRTKDTTTVSTHADGSVSVEKFHQELQPEGEWVNVSTFGDVWKPRGVNDKWRPYMNGRWIFNDKVGWYFESDEPWAEITYHYGRWYDDPDQGWVWVPGTEWAPAWVEWRRGKQNVGWRPLPPDNAPRHVRHHTTTTTTTTTRRERGSDVTEVEDEWVFVPARDITTEDISTVRLPPQRVVDIYDETEPVGRVERRGDITVNFALKPDVIEREANVRIQSQNLPRAEAAPVPSQIRSIATEARSTQGGAQRPGTAATQGTGSTQSGTAATQEQNQTNQTNSAESTTRSKEQTGTVNTQDRSKTGSAEDELRKKGQKANQPAGGTANATTGETRDNAAGQRTGSATSGKTGSTNAAESNDVLKKGKASTGSATREQEQRTNAAKSGTSSEDRNKSEASSSKEPSGGNTASDEELKKHDKNHGAQAGRKLPEDQAKPGKQGAAEEQPAGGKAHQGQAERMAPGESGRSNAAASERNRGNESASAPGRGSEETTGTTRPRQREDMMKRGHEGNQGGMGASQGGRSGHGQGKEIIPDGQE